LQIQPQHDILANVGSNECPDGPSFDKRMCRRVHGNLFENVRQNLLLNTLQSCLWGLNQTNGSKLFGQNSVVVILQVLAGAFRPKSVEVGKPFKFPVLQIKPIGQSTLAFDSWDGPLSRAFDRLQPGRIDGPMFDKYFAGVSFQGALD